MQRNQFDDSRNLAGLKMSEDEFYALVDEGDPYEYLDGTVFVREPTSVDHEDLFGFLYVLLRQFVEERGLGVVLGSRAAMRLDERWSPEPEILVVRNARRHLLKPQRLEGPADLVIEIASISRPRADVRLKLPRYREAQVPEIWLVDSFQRCCRAETLVAGTGRYESAVLGAGRLASNTVPGFWLEVSWLWQRPLPSTLACLRQVLA
jgi:Uma2 family endonuclease